MFVMKESLMDEATGEGEGGGVKVVAGPGETQDSMPKEPVEEKTVVADKGNEVVEADAEKEKPSEKAASEEKAKDEPKHSVPKARMDAALIRAREAEARAEAAEARANAATQTTSTATQTEEEDDDTMTIAQAEKRIEQLDVEIAKSMRDEDDEDGSKVAVLLREQRELSEGVRDAKLEDTSVANAAQNSEAIQFDRVVNDLEERIPVLDPEHETFDKDLTDEVVDLARALHAQGGRSQADSMVLAVDYMSSKLGIDGTDTVKAVKKETDIEANVEKAKKMPPDLNASKGGTNSDKAGVKADSRRAMDMSDAEFETLSGNEEELARLRGDFVS